MKILAIGAHPDDIEYGCGGTLLKHAKRGNEIYLLVMTRGDMGGDPTVREKEQNLVAKHLKVKKVFWGDFKDTQLPSGKPIIDTVERVINEVQPDEVYVNYYKDSHQDHANLANAVSAASRYVKNVIFYEDYTSLNFVPDMFVDIEDVLEEKIKLFKLHKSQVEKHCPGDLDIVDSVKAIANFRGFQSKVKYAEGFKPFRILKDI